MKVKLNKSGEGKETSGYEDNLSREQGKASKSDNSKEVKDKIQNPYGEDKRMKGYVQPVGQYYNDQPISQPLKPSGAHFQPQNERKILPGHGAGIEAFDNTDTNPSNLGSSYAVPGKDTFNSETKGDLIHCPMCAAPTLTVLNAMENPPEDIRCTACGARFKSEDLLNAKVMEEITNVLTMSNMVEPISIPRGRYKSFEPDFQKSMPQSINYIDSPEYKALLKKYLNDLSETERSKIILIIKNGIRNGKSIKDISKSIEGVVRDAKRAALIAHTEFTRVSMEGHKAVMKERGVTKVKWYSAPNDGRLCEKCAALNGKIFDIDKVPNPADLHVNCRCNYTDYYE